MPKLIIGAEHHERLRYYNEDGALTDPDHIVAVTRKHGEPSAAIPDPTKDDTGIYDLVWPPSSVGLWFVEVTATGANIIDRVDEFTVCVVRSSVA